MPPPLIFETTKSSDSDYMVASTSEEKLPEVKKEVAAERTEEQTNSVVRHHPHSYSPGRAWKPLPVHPLRTKSPSSVQHATTKRIPPDSSVLDHARKESDGHLVHSTQNAVDGTAFSYQYHLEILSTTNSLEEAWQSYSALLSAPSTEGKSQRQSQYQIPLSHLHRLARILARTRPKTRLLFTRLTTILRHIRRSNGTVHVHEWNALIDCAGKGWRRGRPEDFALALGVFNDMVSGRMPGSTGSGKDDTSAGLIGPQSKTAVTPDIFTYNTLINIAAHSRHAQAIHQATALLRSSGITPNRVTHLALLRVYTHNKQIHGVRSTLLKMRQQQLSLGLDGVNACLWAFAHVGRVDVVRDVYQLLRRNLDPDALDDNERAELKQLARRLADEEHIVVDDDMKPNEITFTLVIQILAYSGDLVGTLNVFMDMLSTPNTELGAPLYHDVDGTTQPFKYAPSMGVFRSIFLGFTRHAISPTHPDNSSKLSTRLTALKYKTAWDLDNLDSLFQTFLNHALGPASQSTIYWIMMAFSKTSGDDAQIMREVWVTLERRFDGPWGGSNNRLQKMRAKLFPESDPKRKLGTSGAHVA